jgi:hypothetical protein
LNAYLKGQLQVQCRDIRDLDDGRRVVILVSVLLDEEGKVLCELQPAEVEPGKALQVMNSITFVPVAGKLEG